MKDFRFNNAKQTRIYNRLKQIGSGPACYYRDACNLLQFDDPLESTSHLVAHLFREIESGICAVLEMPEDREIREKSKSKEGHRVKIKNILKILDIPNDDKISVLWLEIIDEGLYSQAHRNALDSPRSVNKEFLNTIDKIETIFDDILAHFESKYLEWIRLLDDLLIKTQPTIDDLKFLRNNVPNNPVAMGYFFERLNHPGWLIPLHKGGFFDKPPEPEINPENSSVHFPLWPQSYYLVKMAKDFPEYVLKIILEMPDTTNIRIHDKLIDAFLAMPPEIAACGVLKVKTWINSLHLQLFIQNYGKLILHLTRGNQEEAALNVAKYLLEPKFDAKTSTIIGHCDPWEYKQILNEILPDLIKLSPIKTLTLLCDLLQESARLSINAKETDRGFYPWRRTIEMDEKHGPRDLTEPLISEVRNVAISLMATNGQLVLDIVTRYNYKIFKRIELHLRRKYPKVDKEGTEKWILDPNVFDDSDLRYEYHHLLKEQFGNYEPATQTSFFKLIETGFGIEKQFETREILAGTELSKDEKEKILKYWQYRHLHPISTYLNDSMKMMFIALRNEFGELEHPDSDFSSGVWVGPTSPKPSEEIQSMAIDELISYLQNWRPTKDFMSPSPEGLGMELQKIITSNPNHFADNAEKFKVLDSTYIRALFSGLRDAIKQGIQISWIPVFNLCDWVMTQPRDIPGRKRDLDDFDFDWGWTRKSIVEMLSTGFECGSGEVPFNLRNNAWKVLSQITNDPDPTPEDEIHCGHPNMSPAELSINTTRGEAMHAVIRYALWVRKHIEGDTKDQSERKDGFKCMPEVMEILEHHLDPANDPSLAIRSVYGQWFPHLYKIDANWASSNVKIIFPLDDALKIYFNTAWGAYVTFNNPYDDVFELLNKEYHHAIEHIASTPSEESHRFNPNERLAEHLMTRYWQGKITLTDQEGLLTKFYQKAPSALLSHAIEFIGFSLQKTNGDIPPQIIDKFKALWLHRLNIVKEQHPHDISEIIPFWRWFNSEKFDDKWALNQLIEVLKLSGRIKPEILITKRLATLSSQMPSETITCLNLMLEDEKEWWVIHSCKDDARIILENGLQKGDENAKEIAKALINKLAFNGFTEFRTLLSSQ